MIVCSSFIVNFSFCHHLIDIHLYKFFSCLGVNKMCLNRFNFFAIASSGWGNLVDPKLFHCELMGEVHLIQNFLFHRVLGELKI